MTAKTVLLVVSSCFALLSIAASVMAIVFASAATWYAENARLAWVDRAELQRRKAAPPWYVRLSDRFDRGDGAS